MLFVVQRIVGVSSINAASVEFTIEPWSFLCEKDKIEKTIWLFNIECSFY